MRARFSISLVTLLAGLLGLSSPVRAFYFYWDASAYQCEVHQLTWQDGTPPFTAYIVPIFGSPFQYNIPASAYSNNSGTYDILVQLNAGTTYIVMMSDQSGGFVGGTSQVRRVQVSDQTGCLYTANQNQTSLDFTFTVSGVAEQCERGFEMSWTGGQEYGPYNFTVIPLDQSFLPYDVPLKRGESSMSDWKLNMTQGTRFTIMMNNAAQYGRGGVAGVYEVNNETSQQFPSGCIDQQPASTGPWPLGLATNTLSPATLPVTAPANANKGLTGGGIAGVVIGALAALAILALALWFLLRRRKRRHTAAQRIKGNDVDLADESIDGRSTRNRSDSLASGDGYHRLDPFVGGYEATRSSGDAGTTTTAGYAGFGAGQAHPRLSGGYEGDSARPSGPGTAGPLPTKSGQSSDQDTIPTLSSTRSPTAPSSTAQTLPSLKIETLSQPSSPITTTTSSNANQGGSMRVINHDDPSQIPTLPPGARMEDRDRNRDRSSGARRRDGPTFRRHEDAGRVPVTRREEEFVDLPPLYTDVPRDGPDYAAEQGRRSTERDGAHSSPVYEDRARDR